MPSDKIISSIKDSNLVAKRRQQMIQGAVALFKEKGFHRTTTREIAGASGFSIGTLYEYIRTKEDVLFLVCDAIYGEVKTRLESAIDWRHPSVHSLEKVIDSYIRLMDDMQDEVLIMYQEVKSLKKDTKDYVMQKEWDMVAMLEQVIATCLSDTISDQDVALAANNIFVQGQMWAFRRWMLQKQFTLETYISRQTHFLLQSLSVNAASDKKA